MTARIPRAILWTANRTASVAVTDSPDRCAPTALWAARATKVVAYHLEYERPEQRGEEPEADRGQFLARETFDGAGVIEDEIEQLVGRGQPEDDHGRRSQCHKGTERGRDKCAPHIGEQVDALCEDLPESACWYLHEGRYGNRIHSLARCLNCPKSR